MNTLYFYKSFLRKMRSHLGKPARLTGLAHLHMNSLWMYVIIVLFWYLKIWRNLDANPLQWNGTCPILFFKKNIIIKNYCNYILIKFSVFFPFANQRIVANKRMPYIIISVITSNEGNIHLWYLFVQTDSIENLDKF